MKIILHVCCGICAAGAAERLMSEGHEVQGYFFNPNIHPYEEYQRRLEVARETASKLDFSLIEAAYTGEEWLTKTDSLKDEPEGGKRCDVCFRIRLHETWHYLNKIGWDAFTTTLTISPNKSADTVNKIGREIGGDKFMAKDFKKQDGFKRTVELAKKWNLYRQDYCGCIYSMRNR